jgi:xanthosine utilization system XapX-like protein
MSEEGSGEDFGEKFGEDFDEESASEPAEELAYSEPEETQAKESPGEDEPEIQDDVPSRSQPALVINVHSWATPIVGLMMLVVGLLVGYLIHPLIPSSTQAETAVAVAPANTPVTDNQTPATAATGAPASLQEVMDHLESQARHIKGDPDATVTLIEFSDFQ